MAHNGSLTFTLPDGSAVEAPQGSTAADVAARIGKGLARAALVAEVDGRLIDLSRPLDAGGRIRILTERDEAAL